MSTAAEAVAQIHRLMLEQVDQAVARVTQLVPAHHIEISHDPATSDVYVLAYGAPAFRIWWATKGLEHELRCDVWFGKPAPGELQLEASVH